MNLKTRLFGSPWESKDAAIRARAVAGENNPELLEQLDRIADQDPDSTVRLAALRRMDWPQAWLKTALDDPDPALRQQADHVLVRKLCENFEPDPAAEDQRWAQWVENLGDAEDIRRLARSARSSTVRRAALQRIRAQGFLGDCLASEADDGLAGEILQRIDQPSTLKRIAPELKKQRKHRYQALVRRLAELEQGSEQHDTRDELALQIIRRIEALARGENLATRREQLVELEQKWQALQAPEADLARRFDGAMAIIRRALAGPERPAPETPPKAPPPAVDPELAQLSEQAGALAASALDDKTGTRLATLVSQFDRRWNAIRHHDDEHAALRQHFQALIGELQARVQAREQSREQASTEKPSPEGTEKPAESGDSPLLEEFQRRSEECDQALEAGDINTAHEALRHARSALDRIPQRARPRAAPGHLQRLTGRLKEMRDWQHWSNNELRERLIERVGEIDAADMHPDAVTERLKELRQRWQELDRQEILPGDKRRFAAPQGQWRRFQQACKQTFEAARPFLEKRTEVREQSLKELDQFLADARQLVESGQTEAAVLVRHQRAAREAIRNLDTLPPKSRGRMASELRNLMDAISGRIEQSFEAVADQKRRLIAEARKLVHEKDRANAIDQAKRLQAEWKKIGRTRRKLDEQLWQEFREPIDPLFEDVKKQRDEQRAAEEEHRGKLEQLCHEAEELAAREGQSLVEATGPMAGLEERFAGISPIPPHLRRRFDKAVGEFRDRLSALRTRQRRQAEEDLMSLAGKLQQAWTDLVQGRTPDWNPPDSVPEDPAAKVLVERLEQYPTLQLPDERQAQVDENTDRARQVVVEMECLSGIESPGEDRQRRMDFQVMRLSSRLGEGAHRPDLATERAQLQRRWLESFPHLPEAHAALEKRFRSADKILAEMVTSQ